MFRFTDLIIFRMTRDCNLNCKYCFMQNKEDFKGERIDFELFKKIINRITEQRIINNKQKDNLSLVFHGGEALILGKEKLYQIFEYTTNVFLANNITYSLALQTNATLIDDEMAKILSKFEINLGLSFDGIDGSNNERTSIKQEIFESKFNILEQNKCKMGFLIVANKSNIDKISESRKYLESITKSFKINYAEDMINPGIDSEIELSGEEMFNRVWKPELDRFLDESIELEYHANQLLQKSLIDILTHHDKTAKSGCGTKYCGAGITMIAVEPDGEMDYCDRYSKKFPEVYVQHALDYDFLGIHQLNKVIKYNKMKYDLYKKYGCNTCYADYICDHGCESFYYSKYNQYGIETRIICDQHKMFYDYVLKNLSRFLEKFEFISSGDVIFKVKDRMLQYLSDYTISVNNNIELQIRRKNND